MFVVIELQKNADGNVANIVSVYDTQAAAESKYHSILAAAAVTELPCHSTIIGSEEGFPLMPQCYKHG